MASQAPSYYPEMRRRVARAFREFRKNGGVALMGFMCCRGCASKALYMMSRMHGLKKVAFWCKQTDANSRRTGLIYVSYFHITGTHGDGKAVGQELVASFRRCGLMVQWSGDPKGTILVSGLNPSEGE